VRDANNGGFEDIASFFEQVMQEDAERAAKRVIHSLWNQTNRAACRVGRRPVSRKNLVTTLNSLDRTVADVSYHRLRQG
jgi:hypothetical protein